MRQLPKSAFHAHPALSRKWQAQHAALVPLDPLLHPSMPALVARHVQLDPTANRWEPRSALTATPDTTKQESAARHVNSVPTCRRLGSHAVEVLASLASPVQPTSRHVDVTKAIVQMETVAVWSAARERRKVYAVLVAEIILGFAQRRDSMWKSMALTTQSSAALAIQRCVQEGSLQIFVQRGALG